MINGIKTIQQINIKLNSISIKINNLNDLNHIIKAYNVVINKIEKEYSENYDDFYMEFDELQNITNITYDKNNNNEQIVLIEGIPIEFSFDANFSEYESDYFEDKRNVEQTFIHDWLDIDFKTELQKYNIELIDYKIKSIYMNTPSDLYNMVSEISNEKDIFDEYHKYNDI